MQTAEECFTRSGRIVGGQSPPCLPRSAASAGYFPEWLWALRRHAGQTDQDRVCRKYRHKGGTAPGASSANVRRCTTRPGATDRRPAAAWTGTAATSCHHRQTTSGLAADSCIILIAGEYLRTWRTLPRVCCLPGKVCTRGV